MKIEEAVRDEIKEVTAYKTPDGKLYPTTMPCKPTYQAELAPYWAIGLGIIGLIVLAALIL